MDHGNHDPIYQASSSKYPVIDEDKRTAGLWITLRENDVDDSEWELVYFFQWDHERTRIRPFAILGGTFEDPHVPNINFDTAIRVLRDGGNGWSC